MDKDKEELRETIQSLTTPAMRRYEVLAKLLDRKRRAAGKSQTNTAFGANISNRWAVAVAKLGDIIRATNDLAHIARELEWTMPWWWETLVPPDNPGGKDVVRGCGECAIKMSRVVPDAKYLRTAVTLIANDDPTALPPGTTLLGNHLVLFFPGMDPVEIDLNKAMGTTQMTIVEDKTVELDNAAYGLSTSADLWAKLDGKLASRIEFPYQKPTVQTQFIVL